MPLWSREPRHRRHAPLTSSCDLSRSREERRHVVCGRANTPLARRPAGTIPRFSGPWEIGPQESGSSRLVSISALAIDAAGNLSVAEQWERQAWKVTPQGTVTIFGGGSPGAAGQSCGVSMRVNGIAVDRQGITSSSAARLVFGRSCPMVCCGPVPERGVPKDFRTLPVGPSGTRRLRDNIY